MHEPAPEDCCVVCGRLHEHYISDTCQDCCEMVEAELGYAIRPVRYLKEEREPMSHFIFPERGYAIWTDCGIEVRRDVQKGIMRGLITPVENLRDDRVKYSKSFKEFIETVEVGELLALTDFVQYIKDQNPYCWVSETSASNAWCKGIKNAPVVLVQEKISNHTAPAPNIYRKIQ